MILNKFCLLNSLLKTICTTFNDGNRLLFKLSVIATLFISSFSVGYAQETIRLWEGKAPGSEAWDYQESITSIPGRGMNIRNVVDPSMTVFLPEPSVANSMAVIVCPGGGFRGLSRRRSGG